MSSSKAVLFLMKNRFRTEFIYRVVLSSRIMTSRHMDITIFSKNCTSTFSSDDNLKVIDVKISIRRLKEIAEFFGIDFTNAKFYHGRTSNQVGMIAFASILK